MKRLLPIIASLAASLAAPAALAQADSSARPAAQAPPSAADDGQARAATIRNLQNAASGEANAAHRYELFARKADQEGYGQVAKLFRAAAESEQIHQRNHEAVLRSLGEQPACPRLEKVTVGDTRANLKVPLEGEKNEASEMYPRYAQMAQAAGIPAATRTFTYAGQTEQEHLHLFEDALRQLGSNPPADYYVQSESGMLTEQRPARVAAVTAPAQASSQQG